MADIIEQWRIESESNPEKFYVVSELTDGSFSCGYIGWTRHVPRSDCKHIRWLRQFGGLAIQIDPLLAAVEKVNRRAAKKAGVV